MLVTDDPDDLELGTGGPMGAPHRLFFGDPGSLSPAAAAQTAVVTTATVAATDLSVLVDRRGATLHPMGRVVRPHLQSVEAARHLQELTMPREERDVRRGLAPQWQSRCALRPGARLPWPPGPSTCGF